MAKTGIAASKFSSICNDVKEDTSKTFCKNNLSDHHNFQCEESFISEILSLFGNVGAFINKIITMNGRLLRSNSSAILRKTLNSLRKEAPMHDHSQVILKDYDPLAAGTLHYTLSSKQATFESREDDSRDINFLSQISTGQGCSGINKVKHSMIEDKGNDARYLLIGTGHSNDLIRDFGRPYKVERSLLMRSRLKNSASPRDHPYPFSLVRRARKMKPEGDVAKGNEDFRTLQEAVKADGNNGNLSETRKHDNGFKEEISREHFTRKRDDAATNEASVAVEERRLIDYNSNIANDELVTNVHDYFGLQTETNTSVCKFTKLQIYEKVHNAHSY